MSVNGKTCWSKTGLVGTSGTNQCGRVWAAFKDERFEVRDCYVTLEANAPLTVRVWTSLDSHSRDESFAINNVVIQLIEKGISRVFCVRETTRRCPCWFGKSYCLHSCTRAIAISTRVARSYHSHDANRRQDHDQADHGRFGCGVS